MNQQQPVLRQILNLCKIGGGLLTVYVIYIFITIALYSLGEVKMYSHCDTYQGFFKTAQARNIAPDSSRISDLRAIGTRLVLYYEEYGEYPVITSGTSNERWNNLLDSLELNSEDQKKLSDLCVDKNSNYQYSYGSNNDGTDYVLRTIMSEGGIYQSELRNDIYGIWCGESNNDREYCIGPLE